MTALARTAQGLRTFASDIAQGFFEITHNSFALVGLAVVFSVVGLTARPDLRDAGEIKLRSWLQARQVAALGMEVRLDAIDRATAANPHDLPKQQAAVAYWLSKKYRVAPEPLSALVAEAYVIGERAKLDPTLILAVMAICMDTISSAAIDGTGTACGWRFLVFDQSAFCSCPHDGMDRLRQKS
jgi:hypothetical protein